MNESSIAVGVVAGGHFVERAVDALFTSVLYRFPHFRVYGDASLRSPAFGFRIHPWPTKYACAQPISSWGHIGKLWPDQCTSLTCRTLGTSSVWSRCIQMKFLYALLEIRLAFVVNAYMLTELDVLIHPSNLLHVLGRVAANAHDRPWALHNAAGTPHILSSRAMNLLQARDLWMCSSRSMFAGPKAQFDACHRKLDLACGTHKCRTVGAFVACVRNLTYTDKESARRCVFSAARPEVPVPLITNPIHHMHNQDTLLGACLRGLNTSHHGLLLYRDDKCVLSKSAAAFREVAQLTGSEDPLEFARFAVGSGAFTALDPARNDRLSTCNFYVERSSTFRAAIATGKHVSPPPPRPWWCSRRNASQNGSPKPHVCDGRFIAYHHFSHDEMIAIGAAFGGAPKRLVDMFHRVHGEQIQTKRIQAQPSPPPTTMTATQSRAAQSSTGIGSWTGDPDRSANHATVHIAAVAAVLAAALAATTKRAATLRQALCCALAYCHHWCSCFSLPDRSLPIESCGTHEITTRLRPESA